MDSARKKDQNENLFDKIMGFKDTIANTKASSKSSEPKKVQKNVRNFKPNTKFVEEENIEDNKQQESVQQPPSQDKMEEKNVEKRDLRVSKEKKRNFNKNTLQTEGTFSEGFNLVHHDGTKSTEVVFTPALMGDIPPEPLDPLENDIKDPSLPSDFFTPITLPLPSESFNLFKKKEQNVKGEETVDSKNLRQDKTQIFNSDKKLPHEDLFLFQFPSILPLKNSKEFFARQKKQLHDQDQDEKEEKFFGGLGSEEEPKILRNSDDGFLGKLRVHKSGRMSFVLGNHVFEVKESMDINFLQQIYAVNQTDPQPYVGYCGKVAKKFLIKPDYLNLNQLD